MSVLTLAASALLLGFVHGLGADHLMAIAALSVDTHAERRRGVVVQTAVGFAVGHTIVLGIGAALAIAFGWVLPMAFTAGAERVGGVVLVGLGLVGCWGVFSGRAYGHLHRELNGPSRWHFHFGRSPRHPHTHSSIPTIMGAVFAASSLRALMLLEPFGASAAALALPVLLLLIMLFGVGILASMSLFGVLLARVLTLGTVETIGRAAAGLVALASILLGGYLDTGLAPGRGSTTGGPQTAVRLVARRNTSNEAPTQASNTPLTAITLEAENWSASAPATRPPIGPPPRNATM